METAEAEHGSGRAVESGGGMVVLSLDVGDVVPVFDLEKAVCSHGLFMMAPNRWDSKTKTLQRPLRLSHHSSFPVCISHPHPSPSLLLISVYGTTSLSPDQEQTLIGQVKRMLRLSDEEHTAMRDFHKIHPKARDDGFGRIFRSPTLFEDMVKCILLCNCQWSRTLSMAQALCELQLELKSCRSIEELYPKTPQKRELKRKHAKKKNVSIKSVNKYRENEIMNFTSNDVSLVEDPADDEMGFTAIASAKGYHDLSSSGLWFANYQSESPSFEAGDFPCPEELACLGETILANRCGLGYRAKWIFSLAKNISENKIKPKELEKVCVLATPSSYDILNKQLSAIAGFGHFTCANVLMCMGFYHKIPSDTETIRHMKQFHARTCTTQTVHQDIEKIYNSYAPFQFLAYWFELWGFYEERFGKLSEMPISDYRLITASNTKTTVKTK